MPNAITEHAAPKRRQITIVTKRVTTYLQRTKEINSSELRELASQCSFLYYFLGPRSRRTLSSFCSEDGRHLSATFRVIFFPKKKEERSLGSERQAVAQSQAEPQELSRALSTPQTRGKCSLSLLCPLEGWHCLTSLHPWGWRPDSSYSALLWDFLVLEYDAQSTCDWAIKAHFFDCEKAASFQVSVTAQKSRGKMIF